MSATDGPAALAHEIRKDLDSIAACMKRILGDLGAPAHPADIRVMRNCEAIEKHLESAGRRVVWIIADDTADEVEGSTESPEPVQ